MYMNVNVQVQTWFKLVARKKDGTESRSTVWFPNMVLDSGLDQMSKDTWIQYCFVGTDSTEVNPKQTHLVQPLAYTQTQQGSSAQWLFDADPVYQQKTITWRFEEGAAKGNLTEIGLGWQTGGTAETGRCWNRALILDADGQPTTMTVLADEYLDVFSEIRLYLAPTVSGAFDLVDKMGKVISKHTYKGIPHAPNSGTWGATGKVTASRAIAYSGALSTNMQNAPAGQLGYTSSGQQYPNPKGCQAVSVFGLNSANGTIRCLMQLYQGLMTGNSTWGYQIEIDPPFKKDATQMLTFVSDITWSRYEGG